MSDNLTKEQRSKCMSNIKSKWTSLEMLIHNHLKGHKIHHKMHPKIIGNPDIIFPDKKIVIFIHGCFWHKCPTCYKEPKSNRDYWIPKIERNIERDFQHMQCLKVNGFTVMTIWEHELKKASRNRTLERIVNLGS